MVAMRTKGENSTQESRPLGESEGTDSTTPVGTDTGTETEFEPAGTDSGGYGSEVDTDPVGSDTEGGFDAEGDTGDVDDILSDLSDAEAEEMVLDVFEGVYGPDEAEGIYEDLQDSLGLDAHQILEILLGEGGGGAYGDGDTTTVDSEVEADTSAAQNGTDSVDVEAAAGDNVGIGASLSDGPAEDIADGTFADDSLADDEFDDDAFGGDSASDLLSQSDDGVDDAQPADDVIDL